MPSEATLRKPAAWQYFTLVLLAVITAAYFVHVTPYVLGFINGTVEIVRPPATLKGDRPVVSATENEAAQAGLRVGDTVLAVNGAELRSPGQLVYIMEYARPGDPLQVLVRHSDGSRQLLTIRLSERLHVASDHWLFVVFLQFVLPLSCVTLGFWVAFLRPREPLAWILLSLLLGFSQIFWFSSENRDGTLACTLALCYKTVLASSWEVPLFLFGIYFPERLNLDRRWPWLKWLVIAPLSLLILFSLTMNVVSVNGYEELNRVVSFVPPMFWQCIGLVQGVLIFTAISSFFAAIVHKYFRATTVDARRRLRLLYFGIALALSPTLLLILASSLQHKALDEYPGWIELPSICATLLFPVTLAYVIATSRAMGIRLVLRQGLRYTLAQRGIRLVQALLTASLALAMVKLADRPGMNAHRMMPVMGIGIPLIFLLGRGAKRLGGWVDRQFFRDSYNAEQLLVELSEEVRSIVETRPLLETVSRRIAESLHVPQVAVFLQSPHPYRLAYALGCGEAPAAELPEGSAIVRHLLEEKQPTRVYLDDETNWINRGLLETGERSVLERLHSELLVPLLAMGRLQGFISLSRKRSEEPYSRTDLLLLASVASQTGLALENARLTSDVAEAAAQREAMKREVEIAREVQERLFPQHPPKIAGLDYCGHCRPARGVGGDYYDFLLLPAGELGIAVGDVAGKGISAALMMASLQASLRGQTSQGVQDLAALVKQVNRLVYEVSSPERYATFFFGLYDAASRVLNYVNAGHNPPMLLSRCGTEWKLRRLEAGGTVVGLLPDFDYRQDSVQLAPGDLLVAFTDGISEAMNGSDEEWGEEQMQAELEACDDRSARETLECIFAAADAFAAGARQYDDMTLVVMRVE